MEYKIAARMASMKPSMVREILKASADPEVIALSAGNPSVDAFPIDTIARLSADILTSDPIPALQYSITEGYAPLRDILKSICADRYGMPLQEYDDLIIVSGAQQGADLLTKSLVNEGETVLCEEPSFIGNLNCFRSYGAHLVGIPMEADGVDLNVLESEMQKPNVKFFYTIPNFQNPSGITTSLAKRKSILDLAKKYNVVVLEDNPYGDLRFAGEHIPNIKSMDTEGHVVYVGSFSKILAPGLRVGYLIAPKPLMNRMIVGKQCSDVHTSMLPEMICHRFLRDEDLDAHLSRLRRLYGEKCRLMQDAIDSQWNPAVTHTSPEGGLFLWCTLPSSMDMMEFCRKAAAAKVTVVPGIAFLADDTAPCQSFRMCYATPTAEAIAKGIALLAPLTKA